MHGATLGSMNPTQAVNYLRSVGWSDHKIAIAVDATTPNIWRIRKGANPQYALGAALVDLAKAEQEAQKAKDAA